MFLPGDPGVLGAVLDAAHNGILAVDRASRIVLINAAAERMLGVRRETSRGKPVQAVLPNTALPNVLATGQAQVGEQIVVGGRRLVTNRTPIYQNGAVVGAVAVFQDLADVESSELRAVIEASSDGIYVTDGNGCTTRVNSAYERITGIRREEVLGQHMADLVKRGYFSESVTLLVLERKEPVTIIQRIRGTQDVVVTGTPVKDEQGRITMVVTSVRDVTQLERLQKELREVRAMNAGYRDQLASLSLGDSARQEILGRSPAIKSALELAAQVAPFPTTVLIEGESGVGKELIAGHIHRLSRSASGPFIKVNCGAIPEHLLESELFGYESGAFTGARKSGKPGLFELADKGTFLLDEIDSLSHALQAKLLHALQDQSVMRVGGSSYRRVHVRLLSATNKNLEQLVAAGQFRPDLFYRLNVVRIRVPALRERREDIPLLVGHYLDSFCRAYGLERRLSQEAMARLVRYDWPGNIRELRNLVENMVVSNPGSTISAGDLPLPVAAGGGQTDADLVQVRELMPLRDAVAALERRLMQMAIADRGSLRQAARALGVDHATLLRKARRLEQGP